MAVTVALGMHSVGDGIPDNVLREHLEQITGFSADATGNILRTTSANKTADGGFGDARDDVMMR